MSLTCKKVIGGVVDTGEQFFGSVVEKNRDKFLAFWLFLTAIGDTGETTPAINCSLVSTTLAINCTPMSTTSPINFLPVINCIYDRGLFFLQNCEQGRRRKKTAMCLEH